MCFDLAIPSNRHRLTFFLVLFGLFALPTLTPKSHSAPPDPKTEQEETFFETNVRPLLIKHCVECHGPEDQSGELRLDRKIHFQRGGSSGPVVVAGDLKGSRLIRAIGYRDSDLQMPPDAKLPEQAINILSQWVEQGSYWPDESTQTSSPNQTAKSPSDNIDALRDSHWSFQPIATPERSSTEHGSLKESKSGVAFEKNAIDRLVRAKLADSGLAPNPPADRRTLIHRAYFTLLGLPPSYDEVEAFLSDRRPDAFARLVDRLLSNPHYGERWARHWLDIARYGDTTGYLAGSMETRYPYAYTYRDYVIDAFNEDKPFDDFIIEQIAADQLHWEEDQRGALAAMGFLTVGRRFMNRQQDIIDDRIDVVTRGFLGLSVSCARCHDHKYDPIPTADYYSLYGVFASSEEPGELPLLGKPRPSPQYDAFLKVRAEKQDEVDQWLEQRRVETEHELRSRVGDYLVGLAKNLPQYRKGKPSLQGKRGPLRIATGVRWHQYLANPSQSPQMIWVLWRQLAAIPASEFAEKSIVVLDTAAAIGNPKETASGKRDEDSPASTDVDLGKSDSKLPARLLESLRDAKPQSMIEAAEVFGKCLESVYSQWVDAKKANPQLDRLPDPEDEMLRQVLLDANAPTSLDHSQMIGNLDQGQRNQYNQMLSKVNGVSVTHPGAPPRGMVLVDKSKPVEPVIFRRGVPSNRGDAVPRRFLQVLSRVDGGKPFSDGSGRLELARAIAHPNNPLTARVIVNRVWQHQFGEGLVRTSSDFGTRGELPTHPELLDHLAAEFVADGWSIKRLQRRIMLSETWQQSSQLQEAAAQTDPENRLLWHMPRRRMEFEPLRDRLLVAAGRLDQHIGGRSVMIHRDATRRGLYAYIDREDLPGLLASFDLPSPDASQAKRSQTTVPQQALYLMNSKFVIEQAKALATRTKSNANPNDTESRIEQMYRSALARRPSEEEFRAAVRFIESSARDVSKESLDPWVQFAQVLLLCNEFAFVD